MLIAKIQVMKFALLCLLICCLGITSAAGRGIILEPVPLEQVRDSICAQEVKAILSGTPVSGKFMYKTQCGMNNIIHAVKSWEFSISLNNEISDGVDKNQFSFNCSSGKPVLNFMHFMHVKYMDISKDSMLLLVNKEIADLCNNGPLNLSTKAYMSGDASRHYLYMAFSNGTQKKEFVFIIKQSNFYQCVLKNSM